MFMLDHFLLCFIPLFVALDVIGVLPLYISFTESLTEKDKNKLTIDACLVALILSLTVLAAGSWIFRFLGITESDFRIGGGLVLLCLAIADLLFSQHQQRRKPDPEAGIVPLGTPLIMGPAALTTLLISVDTYGYLPTLLALLINLGIVFFTFHYSFFIFQYLGKSGSKAIAKVASLFLAAIGVMMIRSGIFTLIRLSL